MLGMTVRSFDVCFRLEEMECEYSFTVKLTFEARTKTYTLLFYFQWELSLYMTLMYQ